MEKFKDWIEKATILLEALPYIKRFYGSTMVIKIGGEPMIDEESKENLALNLILLKYVGINPVVIHGGGQQITDLMKSLGKEAIFIEGLRVTDKETMNITEMVLTGMVNKDIVGIINHHGGKAVGISGKDGNLMEAEKLDKGSADLGYVGQIKKINPDVVLTLSEKGFIPIISPVGIGHKGESFNINADTAASRIAVALHAVKLILLTNVRGIYKEPGREDSFLPTVKIKEAEKQIKGNIITKGMLPKVESCIYALKQGVEKAHIINGLIPHSIILEIFTESGIGTQIIK
ncbi:MAG: acetylglutamate kinase [Spirochaetes bacterium]|nr:acetylglutamate kinase [Spirochaetota bacterium]